MNMRLARLAAERRQLLEKIESQRMEVTTIAQRWQKPLALADMGMGVLHFLRNHPILVSGGAAVLFSYRRKGMVGMAREWGRMLRLYSSPLSFVLKFLSPATRSQDDGRNAE